MVKRNNTSIITILRRYSKVITAFLVVNFLTSLVYPIASFALTAGPTAPEYSSFEPFDTSTMVNKLNGDMVYNIPLFEVPGPAGSYPLSLSYHAGIAPDVEASWVGLGWTLNPGSITRLVNGYPDDHNGVIGVTRDFWEGGETESYTVGVSFGVANMATVSHALTFAHDTYQGFDVGATSGLGIGFDLGNGLSLGANVSAGKSPHGGIHTSAGVGLSIGGTMGSVLKASGTLGLSVNSQSGVQAGLSGGVSYSQAVTNDKGEVVGSHSSNLMGASISSNGKGNVTAGIFGSYGFNNGKAGTVSTKNMGLNFSVDIPTPIPGINLKLGRNKVRYWSDETESVETYGNLYNTNPTLGGDAVFDNRAEDIHDLVNPLAALSPNYQPLKDLNGTVAGADYYNVTGQGISGSMKPYQYTSYLNRQNKKLSNGDYLNKNYHFQSSAAESTPHFRFEGDFSNRLEYTLPSFIHSQGEIYAGLNNFFNTGNDAHNGFVNEELIGSKHIDFMTNADFIANNHLSNSFLETNSSGFNRSATPNDQIGGFVITNESGVSYHYSLPVYSYDEHIYTENIDHSSGRAFNHLTKEEPYAYTWLLTAVTGPDFVDRGGTSNIPNGVLDDDDWGYWVEFDYGMTADAYKWRNPSSGFNRDLDAGFQTFSIGKKEIYYLDAIRTQSHTALFLKDVRLDGKGITTSDQVVTTPGGETVVVDDGGFEAEDLGGGTYDVPMPSMKLDKIILAQNEDLPVINKTLSSSQSTPGIISQLSWDNTLDIYDEVSLNLESSAVRTINFGTDYELQQGTPNSFSNDFYDDTDPTLFFNSYVKNGKLTLKSLDFAGKQGASLIPPMEFQYAKNPAYDEHAKDLWGFYKSDYTGNGLLNENLVRMTTVNSSVDVDAWSLSSIVNSLGSVVEINYESDDYSRSELVTNKAFIIDDVVEFGSEELTLTLETFGLNLDDIFTVGQIAYPALTYTTSVNFAVCTHLDMVDYTGLNIDPSEITNVDAANNQIRIRKPTLVALPNIPSPPSGCESYTTSIQFTGGNLSYFSDAKTYGGGLRVNSISTNSPISQEKTTTHYEYNIPNSAVSSGVTSYEPITFDLIDPGLHEDAQFSLKQHLYASFNDLLQKSSEVPGPGVMYEYVTVKESVTKEGIQTFSPGYSTYQFQTFDKAMVDYDHYDDKQSTYGNRRIKTRNVKIHDLSSHIGNLKGVSLHDLNGEKISETINHYLIDDLLSESDVPASYLTALERFDKQGVLAETFANGRITINENSSIEEDLVGLITQKILYPSIQVGQTNTNYLTGITTETKNLKFDFFSGQVLDTYDRDKYGNEYVHASIPAYRLNDGAAYPEMGPMSASSANKNMLTQEGVRLSLKVTGDYDPETHVLNGNIAGLVSGHVTTWEDGAIALAPGGIYSTSADQDGLYRMKETYDFIGTTLPQLDGTYAISSYEDLENSFNLVSNQPNLSYGWRFSTEVTLYDVNSHALEAKDLNGNYATTKMDLLQQQVLATASNSEYSELAFSGAEDGDGEGPGINNFGGGVTQPHGIRVHIFGADGIEGTSDDHNAHTGLWSIQIADGTAFRYVDDLRSGQLYRALAWCSEENAVKFQVNIADGGVTDLPTKVLGSSDGWFLHEAVVEVDDGTSNMVQVEILTTGISTDVKYIDDFRLQPVDATATSFVYNEWGELSDILDQNNLFTHYEYDQMGRLKTITRETFNHGPVKVSETIINYARSNN